MDPPGEEGDDGVPREAEAGAGGGPAVADGEPVEVHSGVDDRHLGGVGLVVPDELVGLLGGVRDQPIGGGHDLGLAYDAGGGLWRVPLGQRRVLDLRHGVHGVHERDAPAFGGEPAHVAGKPVVGVDEVVVAGAVAGPSLHDAVGEGAQLGRELLLGETFVGARVHVPDEDPGGQVDHGRQPAGGGPGEDLDLDVDRGEPLGQLDDVDVHAAGVAGAGLVQRRGVHAQHGHAARLAVVTDGRKAQAGRLVAGGTGGGEAATEAGHVLAQRTSPLGSDGARTTLGRHDGPHAGRHDGEGAEDALQGVQPGWPSRAFRGARFSWRFPRVQCCAGGFSWCAGPPLTLGSWPPAVPRPPAARPAALWAR